MLYVSLPDNRVRPLPFYLAMEEYLARNSREELFFMWQVEPTVIFGRNQIISREVDLDYCRDHHIHVVRRKSGGGCVYADMDNIMLSYIVNADNVATTFSAYTEKVAAVLRKLGLDASSTGRNDVTIGGRKVSGNAFYHLPGRSIVHGTMLYDTDAENMARAISPSPLKLSAKGVESVRSHITTVSQHSDISLEEFKSFLRENMTDGDLPLTRADVEKIEEISRQYFDHDWLYGRHSSETVTVERRIEGVGEFQVSLAVKAGLIADLNMRGDFFLLGDLDERLLNPLRGVAYEPASVREAVAGIELGNIIHGLTANHLITLLFDTESNL